jgi:hypothetical protein
MATAAQIQANRRNAQNSCGPKTNKGKSRSRCNSLRHGLAAVTILPVLPQEDPKKLEELIQNLESDLQPQTADERILVQQAALLAYSIERGERLETAHLAGRVRKAARHRLRRLNARRRKQLRELGRRLLYIAGPEEIEVDKMAPWADDPALLVTDLEETTAGCRWLLERWEEYRNLLDRRLKWSEPVLVRFIRLQGKNMIESIFDPALNSIFLAWDVLYPNYAAEEWESFRKERRINDPAYNHRLRWQEITRRPGDPAEAWGHLHGIVNHHVSRLNELLIRNAALEDSEAEDPDWADRAAFDASLEIEGFQRYQAAKRRELRRTFETLHRMRNTEYGMRNGEDQGVASKSGGDDEPMTEQGSSPVVRQDSNLVLGDSRIDKIDVTDRNRASVEAFFRSGCGMSRNIR